VDTHHCIVLSKMQWELTATFQGIFEHSRKREKRVSIKSGTKISVENVWMHPSYDSITFANNLALVKLKCHDINVNVDFTKTNCSIPLLKISLVIYIPQRNV